MILNRRLLQEDLLENSVASDELPGYLLYPTVLSRLPTGYQLLVAHENLMIILVSRKVLSGKSQFEGIEY